MIYTKKIRPGYYNAILDEKKRFEIRKEDDFFAFCGDYLLLKEWTEYSGYTGRAMIVQIVFIHRGDPLPKGLAVYGIEKLDDIEELKDEP